MKRPGSRAELAGRIRRARVALAVRCSRSLESPLCSAAVDAIGKFAPESSIVFERRIGQVIETRYQQIVTAVDAEFARNRELHGAKIHCRPGCTECCHHVFSITEIEAAQIAKGLARLPLELRAAVEARAREYIIRALIRGDRLPCPALEQDVCSIYEHRPLMCHKFGMPLYNPEKPDRIFACELNFKAGEEIRDPQLIPVQTAIHAEWNALQAQYRALSGAPSPGPLTVAHAILRANGA